MAMVPNLVIIHSQNKDEKDEKDASSVKYAHWPLMQLQLLNQLIQTPKQLPTFCS